MKKAKKSSVKKRNVKIDGARIDAVKKFSDENKTGRITIGSFIEVAIDEKLDREISNFQTS